MVMELGQIVLSALLPDTIANRINQSQGQDRELD
jgi:regulator of extracellular matrix RemA (YlzA/DUF370 family)